MSKRKQQLKLLPDTIQERFEIFHAENPHVYRLIEEQALRAKHFGRKRFGIGAIIEYLRWQYYVTTRGDKFKLPNEYRSRYARLLLQNRPDLDGFFVLRELRTQ